MTARHFFRINSSKTCFWTIPKQLLDISWTVPEHFSWMELVQEMLKCMDPLRMYHVMTDFYYWLQQFLLDFIQFDFMFGPMSARSFFKTNQKIHFLKTCSSPSPTMWELSPDPKILVLSGPCPKLWPKTQKLPKNWPKMAFLKDL